MIRIVFILILILPCLKCITSISDCKTGFKEEEKMHFMECYNVSSFIFDIYPTNIDALILNGGSVDSISNDIFKRFLNVKYLELHHIPIKNIDSLAFNQMTSLKSIIINSHMIERIQPLTFKNLTSLLNLTITNGLLKELDENWIDMADNLEFINLSNNELFEIKEYHFCHLKKLKYLNLTNNKISYLKVSPSVPMNKTYNFTLFEWKSLENIQLENNIISTIDDAFRGLVGLKSLNLQNNQISRLYFSLFKDLSSLEKLNLNNNNIHIIENGTFANQKLLKTLILKNNNLTRLSPILYGLVNLQYLFLDNNNLGLFHNDNWDEFLINLIPNIFSISFNYNRLNNLWNWRFGRLKKLEELSFNNNQFINMDWNSWNYIYTLRKIDMSFNSIRSIKLHQAFFKSLQYLNLSSNNIDEIKEHVFKELSNVKVLDLSKNLINSLQKNLFSGMENITRLYINNNKIISIENETFVRNKYLNTLYLHDNFFDLGQVTESGVFNFLPYLNKVTLHGNILSSLDSASLKPFIKLKFLNLNNLGIRFINLTSLNATVMIEEFHLNNNFLQKINYGDFTKFHHLETLNLDKNKINFIADYSFNNTKHLKQLSLAGNLKESITKNEFYGLDSLTKLILSNNLIQSVEQKSLEHLLNLSELYLDSNNLSNSIPNDALKFFTKLRTLTITNNSLVFSCNLYSTLNMISESKISNDFENPIFKQPEWLHGLSLQNLDELVVVGEIGCTDGICYNEFNISCDLVRMKYGRSCHDLECYCQSERGVKECFGKQECKEGICQNNGTCIQKNNSFYCSCKREYYGKYCENKNCSVRQCHNDCPHGYYGDKCSKKYYICKGNECKNNGYCVTYFSTFKCVCPTGYTGSLCEYVEIFKCDFLTCKNGGKCFRKNNTEICKCPEDYYGNECELQKDSFFDESANIIMVCIVVITLVMLLLVVAFHLYDKKRKKNVKNRFELKEGVIDNQRNGVEIILNGKAPIGENIDSNEKVDHHYEPERKEDEVIGDGMKHLHIGGTTENTPGPLLFPPGSTV